VCVTNEKLTTNQTEVHFDQTDRAVKEINCSFLTIHCHSLQNRRQQALSKDPNDRFFSSQSSRLSTQHIVGTGGTKQSVAQHKT